MEQFEGVIDWFDVAVVAMIPVVLSFIVTAVVLGFARWRGHYAVPNERSSHAVPTPKSGGIGIVVSVTLLLIFGIASAQGIARFDDAPLKLMAATLIACGIGLLDDMRGLSPRIKLALFLVPAVLALVLGGVVHGVPFVGDVALGWAWTPLIVFWLACYPQAFNFMDGIDGIAGLTAIVSMAVFFIAAWRHETGSGISGWVALATIGFLPFNFPKARIFLGDAGSLPLGLLLAWCAIEANSTGALPFPASVLLLGPFLFDVTFTLIRRVLEKKKIGEAHKEHLYQRLSRVWNSHAKVSLLYAGFSCVTGVLALQYAAMSDTGKLLSLVLPTVAMLGFAALVLRAEREKGR